MRIFTIQTKRNRNHKKQETMKTRNTTKRTTKGGCKFIQRIANDQGVTKTLTAQEIRQAHNYANLIPQDYYYRLKEYFYN